MWTKYQNKKPPIDTPVLLARSSPLERPGRPIEWIHDLVVMLNPHATFNSFSHDFYLWKKISFKEVNTKEIPTFDPIAYFTPTNREYIPITPLHWWCLLSSPDLTQNPSDTLSFE